jgi:hypothetical protein
LRLNKIFHNAKKQLLKANKNFQIIDPNPWTDKNDQERVNDLSLAFKSPGKLRSPSLYSHLEFVQQDLRVGEDEIQIKVKKLKE